MVSESTSEDGRDHYLATLEDGSLVMEPYCACGNQLSEKYFCETCNRQCRCADIICDNEDTLKFVSDLIAGNPKFRNFRAYKK